MAGERRPHFLSTELTIRIATIGITSFLVIVPLFFLFFGSVRTAPPGDPGDFTFRNYEALLENQRYQEALVNTIEVAIASLAVACLLGIPAAWITARTNTPFANIFSYLALVPLFISPLMSAVAWALLAGPEIGLFNNVTKSLGIGTVFNANSFWGIAWVMGLTYSTLIYLFVSSALKSMDPSLEEVSRISGAGVMATTLRVTLPVIAPALLSGMLLVFVLAAENFSIPTILGGPRGYFVLTTIIFTLISQIPTDYGLATSSSISLFVITGLGIYLYRKVVSSRSYVTVTGKGFKAGFTDIRRWKYLTFSFIAVYLLLASGLPIAVTLVTSFSRLTGVFWPPTTVNYANFFKEGSIFWLSLRNSMLVSIIGASLSLGLAIVIAWIIERSRTRGRGLLDYLTSLPLAMPSMVIAVGILWTYTTLPLGIYGTIWILIVASITRFMTYGVRSVSSNMVQIHRELEESSRICGASWVRTLYSVTIPLLKPGIAAGWILQFIIFFRELTIVLLLWTSQTITLAVLAFEIWIEGSYPSLAAITLVQAAIIAVVVITYQKILGGDLARIAGPSS